MTIFAEQYDFVVTLLLLPDECRCEGLDAAPEGEDVFDRLHRVLKGPPPHPRPEAELGGARFG